MAQTVVIAALEKELLPLLEKYTIKEEIRLTPGIIYRGKYIDFVRTGVGVNRCISVTREYLKKNPVKIIFNMGTAGALNKTIPSGGIFLIDWIQYQNRFIATDLGRFKILSGMPRLSLVTVDHPVVDEQSRREILSQTSMPLVDMESFHLATVAAEQQISFLSVKVVTDFANDDALEDFSSNLEEYTENLAEEVENIIAHEVFRRSPRL